MVGSRPECVADATVLIDLHEGRILAKLAQMPVRFFSPDAVVADIEEPDAKTLSRAGLEQKSLPGEAVLLVMSLARENRRISVADATALVLAERTGRTLLTGDRRLRELAGQRGVTVHGTLWLLERMVEAGVLTSRQAAAALERMLACGRRLPEAEARTRIRKWQPDSEVE